MSNAPYFYDYQNSIVSQVSPNSAHIRGSTSFAFYRQLLMQDMISLYKWTLPSGWNSAYFLYGLYEWGRMAVINTDRYGIIPQGCGLLGYNVQYAPTHAIIANPLLRGILQPQIGTQCSIIRLMPNYGSTLYIVDHYAELMAAATEALRANLNIIRLAWVFACKDKSAAMSFQKMYDKISSGDPAVFVDSNLVTETGEPTWQLFCNNIKNSMVSGELLQTLRDLKRDFDLTVGIPSANTDKKERLITDEAKSNNVETATKAELWLEQLQADLEETRDLFGIPESKLSVEWRHNPLEGGVISGDPGIFKRNGSLQGGRDPV